MYCAYTDYQYMMSMTEEVIRYAVERSVGTAKLSYQGRAIDFSRPFPRLSMAQAIQRYAKPDHWTPAQLRDRDFLAARLRERQVEFSDDQGWGALHLMLFETLAEKQLIEPIFIVDFPAEVSPLARRKDSDPEIAERFELFVDGKEIANGFSELNDPEEQAARFQEQARMKAAGDAEAMYYDADYIRALEYGLPPTSGAGIGIDRLVMLLTDSPSIRDVILFPQMRPEAAE
jgi:lysyl-tRNA synthetase class 2